MAGFCFQKLDLSLFAGGLIDFIRRFNYHFHENFELFRHEFVILMNYSDHNVYLIVILKKIKQFKIPARNRNAHDNIHRCFRYNNE